MPQLTENPEHKFICVKLIVEDQQTGAEQPPSTLMMTNERADEIPTILLRCENKRGVYIPHVYETWGETVITNEYARLIVRGLPWKQ